MQFPSLARQMHFSHGMQEVVGSIPSSSTISQTALMIFLNGLDGKPLPSERPVTVLQEVPGHRSVTRFGDQICQEAGRQAEQNVAKGKSGHLKPWSLEIFSLLPMTV